MLKDFWLVGTVREVPVSRLLAATVAADTVAPEGSVISRTGWPTLEPQKMARIDKRKRTPISRAYKSHSNR
jgi:hypothetical protein